MGKNIQNIIKQPTGEFRLTDEQLIAYLDGKLSQAEQREIELWLSHEPLEGEAIAGLLNVEPEKIKQITQRINQQLQHKSRRVKAKRHFYQQPVFQVLLAAMLILLCLIASILLIMSA
jgi:ferric-dicitrate binding protein FerR (iron transport regulator)